MRIICIKGIPGKSDSESFTFGYSSTCFGGKKQLSQCDDTAWGESRDFCGMYPYPLEFMHDKRGTMKPIWQLTLPLLLAHFHHCLSGNWHDRHMNQVVMWQRLWKHMAPYHGLLLTKADLAIAACECPFLYRQRPSSFLWTSLSLCWQLRYDGTLISWNLQLFFFTGERYLLGVWGFSFPMLRPQPLPLPIGLPIGLIFSYGNLHSILSIYGTHYTELVV